MNPSRNSEQHVKTKDLEKNVELGFSLCDGVFAFAVRHMPSLADADTP